MTAQQVRSGATDRWRVRAGRGAAPLLRRRRHVPAAARCRLQRSTPAAPCGPVPTSVRVGYAAGSWLVLPPRLRAVPNTRAAHAGSGAPSRSSERQRAAPPAYSSLLATAPPLLPPRPPRQVTAFKLDPARLAALNRVLRGMRVGNFEFAADQLRLGDLQGNRWEGERGACLGGGGGEAAGRHLLVDTILPRHLLGLGGAPCVLQQGRHLSACTHKLKAGALPLPDAQNGMPLAHPLPCCAAGLSWCCAAWSLAAPRRWPPPPRASAPLALSTTTACSGLARGRCPRTGARGRGRGHGFC